MTSLDNTVVPTAFGGESSPSGIVAWSDGKSVKFKGDHYYFVDKTTGAPTEVDANKSPKLYKFGGEDSKTSIKQIGNRIYAIDEAAGTSRLVSGIDLGALDAEQKADNELKAAQATSALASATSSNASAQNSLTSAEQNKANTKKLEDQLYGGMLSFDNVRQQIAKYVESGQLSPEDGTTLVSTIFNTLIGGISPEKRAELEQAHQTSVQTNVGNIMDRFGKEANQGFVGAGDAMGAALEYASILAGGKGAKSGPAAFPTNIPPMVKFNLRPNNFLNAAPGIEPPVVSEPVAPAAQIATEPDSQAEPPLMSPVTADEGPLPGTGANNFPSNTLAATGGSGGQTGGWSDPAGMIQYDEPLDPPIPRDMSQDAMSNVTAHTIGAPVGGSNARVASVLTNPNDTEARPSLTAAGQQALKDAIDNSISGDESLLQAFIEIVNKERKSRHGNFLSSDNLLGLGG